MTTYIGKNIDNEQGNGVAVTQPHSHIKIEDGIDVIGLIGVNSTVAALTLWNSGSVEGNHIGYSGISLMSDEGLSHIVNEASGMISGSLGINAYQDHDKVLNDGHIEATESGGGIYLNGLDETVVNNGVTSPVILDGTRTFGESSFDTDVIRNTGSIVATIGSAVSIVQEAYHPSALIINSGLIDGSVNCAGNALRLINHGMITGGIELGLSTGFTNVIDSRRGGSVEGVIVGSTGIDKIYAGDDGETLDGRQGHDRLYGGAGADIFEFDLLDRQSRDVIVGFDVANDKLRFQEQFLRHLHAGVQPAFSIGDKASSPTDFLYYNSESGLVHYDPDGSGTAHKSLIVANLGKGLALTASNFLA